MEYCLVLSSQEKVILPPGVPSHRILVPPPGVGPSESSGLFKLLGEAAGFSGHCYYTPSGQPVLSEPVLGYISVSHGNFLHAAVYHPEKRVGVDVQWMRSFDRSMPDKTATPFQQAKLRNSPHFKRNFFYLWTAKEAILKAAGHGMNYGLERMQEIEGWGGWYTYNHEKWRVQSWLADMGHVISVSVAACMAVSENQRTEA